MKKRMITAISIVAFWGFFSSVVCVSAQQGQLLRDVVYAPSLESNLLGTDPNQPFYIYLPPGYNEEPNRRYPTIYMYHRYNDTFESIWLPILSLADQLISEQKLPASIIVMPNCSNSIGHSFAASSPVIGNWTEYLGGDLVRYVDAQYRTIAQAESRGLVGTSVGGAAALEVAFNMPEVFSHVYVYSPYAVGVPFAYAAFDGVGPGHPAYDINLRVGGYQTLEDLINAPYLDRISFTMCHIWGANLDRPPFYCGDGERPFSLGFIEDEQFFVDFAVLKQYEANSLLGRVSSLIPTIRQLKNIGIAYGSADFNSDPHPKGNTAELMDILTENDIRFHYLEHDNSDAGATDVVESFFEWGLPNVIAPFMAQSLTYTASAVESDSWAEVKRRHQPEPGK